MFSKTKNPVKLTQHDLRLINTMNTLGDRTRYKIYKLLLRDEELCVTEIAQYLNVSVSAISQHFRTFELIGIVSKVRIGQKICYKLNIDDPIISQLIPSVN